jgi:hypothetical protein
MVHGKEWTLLQRRVDKEGATLPSVLQLISAPLNRVYLGSVVQRSRQRLHIQP